LLADEFWFCPNLLEQQLKKRESWVVTEEKLSERERTQK
jgi:hypothetical protein